MKWKLATPMVLAAAFALAGCGGRIVKDRIVTVNTPVVQPCAGQRPAPVTTLRQDYPDSAWSAMDIRQKAAAVGSKGLERQGHAEKLNAATAACP